MEVCKHFKKGMTTLNQLLLFFALGAGGVLQLCEQAGEGPGQ